MAKKNVTLYIDSIFCVVLLPALIMMLPIDRWLESNSLFVILLFGWLYILYFLNRLVTVPLLFKGRHERARALVIFIVSIIITYLTTRYQFDHPPHLAIPPLNTPRPRSSAIRIQQQGVWYLYVLVTTFSAVVTLLSQLHQQILARQTMEFEKKKAELALYKAQINPHFLFNTLNTLLGLIITKSNEAEEAFMQFTNLMKYMYTNSTHDKVPLATEIEYIEQYIELQRYRLNKHTEIDFAYTNDQESGGLHIAPMLLITFVENALKYGASSHERSLIKISIVVNDEGITLTTQNPIVNQPKDKERGSGIGIINCQNRLELIYPNSYTLVIEEQETMYNTLLTIKLN